MRQRGIILAEFFSQCVERFFWLPLTGDNAERPIGYFIAASEPFVSPGKQNRSRQPALRHTFDVPAKHLGLLVLRVANRVHPELA